MGAESIARSFGGAAGGLVPTGGGVVRHRLFLLPAVRAVGIPYPPTSLKKNNSNQSLRQSSLSGGRGYGKYAIGYFNWLNNVCCGCECTIVQRRRQTKTDNQSLRQSLLSGGRGMGAYATGYFNWLSKVCCGCECMIVLPLKGIFQELLEHGDITYV
jgi:hypothetical protein